MAVSSADVRSVIEIPDEVEVTSFIKTAKLIVEEDLADQGMSAARLDQIIIYLAAHFACLRVERGGLRSSQTLNAKDEYQLNADKGLRSTRYGQQAITLDTSGVLASSAKAVGKAEFRIV